MTKKSQLMTTEEILRTLKRMAHQITEKNNGVDDVVVIGIINGGVPIAHQLTQFLEGIEGKSQGEVPCGALDISHYRDDLDKAEDGSRIFESLESKSDITFDIDDKNVVLVDDVLYTGRTARAAFDALSDFGRAASIQLAVLIDRGHRELPIRADFVGKNIPTSRTETVVVEDNVVNIYDL